MKEIEYYEIFNITHDEPYPCPKGVLCRTEDECVEYILLHKLTGYNVRMVFFNEETHEWQLSLNVSPKIPILIQRLKQLETKRGKLKN